MGSIYINCKWCNKKFKVWTSYIKRGDGLYCSVNCSRKKIEFYKIKERFCLLCGKKLGWSAKYSPERNIKYCRMCFSKSDKFIQKVSRTTFKKGLSPWNKGLKGFMAGEKNNFWKGGISKFNRSERENAMGLIEYKLWRKAIFQRDNFTCVKCFSRGGKLEADHIKPWAIYPELRYAIDNGQTLCKNCHRLKTVLEMKVYWVNQFSSGVYKTIQKLSS